MQPINYQLDHHQGSLFEYSKRTVQLNLIEIVGSLATLHPRTRVNSFMPQIRVSYIRHTYARWTSFNFNYILSEKFVLVDGVFAHVIPYSVAFSRKSFSTLGSGNFFSISFSMNIMRSLNSI